MLIMLRLSLAYQNRASHFLYIERRVRVRLGSLVDTFIWVNQLLRLLKDKKKNMVSFINITTLKVYNNYKTTPCFFY